MYVKDAYKFMQSMNAIFLIAEGVENTKICVCCWIFGGLSFSNVQLMFYVEFQITQD